jgi:hypothetical protein
MRVKRSKTIEVIEHVNCHFLRISRLQNANRRERDDDDELKRKTLEQKLLVNILHIHENQITSMYSFLEIFAINQAVLINYRLFLFLSRRQFV